jgi:hypothetical protein
MRAPGASDGVIVVPATKPSHGYLNRPASAETPKLGNPQLHWFSGPGFIHGGGFMRVTAAQADVAGDRAVRGAEHWPSASPSTGARTRTRPGR